MTAPHTQCRICGSGIAAFMTFGRMPVANGFLTTAEIPDEYFFELAPAMCERCGMFQLVEQPPPQKMFHRGYAFLSGTSRHMETHFAGFARTVMRDHLRDRRDPFVVEIGSNDGIMLHHFKAAGIRHLGVEPSANVAAAARERGIDTLTAFFSSRVAEDILAAHGPADAVLAANVMCHIADLPDVARGVARLLKPDGILMFEDPYLGAMIEKTSYDQIYDEHVFMFSVTSVSRAFEPCGFDLIGVEPQSTHGGSMRYVLAPSGTRPISPDVGRWLDRELAQGLTSAGTYEAFRFNCEVSRRRLMGLLNDLSAQGKRVVGYGATSKSTTVTNYCGITQNHVAFIADTTPIKQGRLSPGAHIPVRPHGDFAHRYPDFALLFAWNHEAEILDKERDFVDRGGRFIRYVPDVRLVP